MLQKLLLLIIFIPSIVMTQNIEVKGKVTSSEDPVPGVNVIEKNTSRGTTTNINGNYSITVKNDAVLVFSSVGYISEEVRVNGKPVVNVVLKEDSSLLQEVIVEGFTDTKGRARKRLESIQRIPESITAVTSSDIEINGIEDIGSLLTQIPGVSYGESQDPGTVIISVRGIPQIRYGPSPIATVVDGVYLASADLNNSALFDIDQIEVIKGSQGLFYGKNAIGGAVVITTKQPVNGTQGRVKIGYGNGNTSSIQANIGGSVTDNKSYYRLGISYLDSDGFIENTTLNENVDFQRDLGIRGQLKFKLGSKSTLSFSNQYGNNKGGAITFASSALNDDFPGMAPNVYEGSPNGDFLGQGTVESFITSASFETVFNGSRLLSHTSYADVNLFYNGDYLSFTPVDNYGPVPAALQEMTRASRTFNQELRLVSAKDDAKFRWNIGLFYQNINADWDTNAIFNQDPTDLTYANVTRDPITNDDNKLNSIGLFGFFEFDLSDRFNIAVGLRNEWETLENFEGVNKISNNRSYNAFQPKVSASYKFAKEKMLYANFSRGFRSGGYNPADVPDSGISKIIDPEFTNSFETGIKTSFWKNRIIFNVAYFNTVFENQQVYRFALDGVRSILGTINYEESKVSGFEVDTKIRLSKNFDFTGGFSIIDSEITKAFEEGAIGNKIPFAPQGSFNIGVLSNFKLGEKSKLITNINFENKGKKYWFADDVYGVDQEGVFQNPYTLVNTKTILEFNKLNVGIWGKNIFNTKYNQEWWPLGVFDGDPIGGDIGDIRTPSRPATFGIEFSYKF